MGQRHDAAFAGCVGFGVGLGLRRERGGDVDDRATWSLADQVQGVFRAEEITGEVSADDAVPLRQRERLQRTRIRIADAGIVDERVYPPEMFRYRLDA